MSNLNEKVAIELIVPIVIAVEWVRFGWLGDGEIPLKFVEEILMKVLFDQPILYALR